MLNKQIVRIAICTALAASVLVGFSACGKSEQHNDVKLQALEEEQKLEKESEKLKKIETEIESLFETLGGPSIKTVGMEKTEETEEQDSDKAKEKTGQKAGQQEDQQSTQKDSKKEQENQDGNKSGQEQKNENREKDKKQENEKAEDKKQKDKKWAEIEKIINSMHYQWNELMPDIAKKGADMDIIDGFDSALNKLTTTIASKENEKALSAANELYSHIPDLYSLYRVKLSPEAKRMIYYARSIILESSAGNWEKVSKDSDAMEKSWSLLRNTLGKKQQEIGDKLNFSIYELKKVISSKNGHLTEIKGKIVLKNLKELQESFEESE